MKVINALRTFYLTSNLAKKLLKPMFYQKGKQIVFFTSCVTFEKNTFFKLQKIHRRKFSGSSSFNSKSGSLIKTGFGLIAAGFLILEDQTKISGQSKFEHAHETVRSDLPNFTQEDLTTLLEKKPGRIVFGVGVYDITEFLTEYNENPKTVSAALEHFWNICDLNKKDDKLKLLEEYRIGNIKPKKQEMKNELENFSSFLVPKSENPFNAELQNLELLVENFITPEEYFYVRNHHQMPNIKSEEYQLQVFVESDGVTTKFSLDDLKKNFEKTGVVSVLMSGKNRSSEMDGVKRINGLKHGAATVGNAVWEGIRLSEFLTALGVKSNEKSHVIFEGYDKDVNGKSYAVSIPLSKAMDPRGDVIIAYEMNGKELSRAHGYPIRVIVPGVVGKKSVKWLAKIIVSSNIKDSVDYETVQNLPVTSMICTPNPLEHQVKIVDGKIEVKGYAFSGGGNKIIRVDITADKGESWISADLQQLIDGENVGYGRHFSWTLFKCWVPITEEFRNLGKICRFKLQCAARNF